ncbi:MAG: beta-ketoacyl-[acyl-carrier-protein] synthase II [Alphaproteobacteria bacterium]|nr:beta-ketoacyl-ACP synthase II [Alphaproteobacteria bacterium]TAD91968.1 MAG: beta-ketoacyl-[acyl-carrier-protein] synthase II [Alphaproteobacteria bacterium]
MKANPLDRRVVVTGLGLVTPLGAGVDVTWKRLIAGRSGLGAIQSFDVSDLPCKVAGQVPLAPSADGEEGVFDPDKVAPAHERRKIGDFIVFALAAAQEAIADAGWQPEDALAKERTGVIIGSGIGGLIGITEGGVVLHEKGPRRLSPFYIPSSLINLASGHVQMRYGFCGPNHSVVTACATGAHAIGDAMRLIQYGDADVMVAGGAEAAVSRIGIGGFAAARALSTNFNDRPTAASRPWDKDRDGFVMGEGAGIVVLEEYEHAKRRGAKIYAEIVGYGLSGDAYHITAPHPEGDGALRAMTAALNRAGLTPADVDYINAHGTSTPLGDEIEVKAVKRLFGAAAERVSMSSTKSAIGHLLGAAGSVEAIFSILALRDQICPPTLNLDNPSEGCDLDLVPKVAKQRTIRAALSNAFGFGGTNSSLLFVPAS